MEILKEKKLYVTPKVKYCSLWSELLCASGVPEGAETGEDYGEEIDIL